MITCRFVPFYNGKAPARSSRAAREWYSRRVSWGASTVRAPLCPPLCGFVSVNAGLTEVLYHRAGELSTAAQISFAEKILHQVPVIRARMAWTASERFLRASTS